MTESLLLRLWGKTDKDNPDRYHPLLFHMLDVAAVCEALWGQSLSAHLRRQLLAGLDLDESSGSRFLAFLAGLHDIGKATPAFQGGYPPLKRWLEGLGLPFPKKADALHGRLTALVLQEWLPRALGLPLGRADAIATALGGHHGTFPSAGDLASCGLRPLGRVPGHRHEWDEARRLLLDAYTGLTLEEVPALPCVAEITPAFLALLAALTSVADWIASAKFPCSTNMPPDDYLPTARQRAEEAVAVLQWVLPSASGEPPTFSQLFDGKRPRPLQQVTAGLAAESNAPGLVIIEAPMGEGKTEAALHLAEAWLRKLGQQGCYFALPTMATANGIFGRFHRDYLQKVHPEAARMLRLLHGQASVSEEYRQFRIDNVYDSGGRTPTGGADAEDWFAYKKRGLLSPYGVGTVDQALLSVLQTKHGFVRLFGLAGKTVIVDEVHAFDFYTRAILGRLLAWLRAAGSSVVLLSATLPRSTRTLLLESWGVPALKDETPYPRVTTAFGGEARAVHVAGSAMARCVCLQWIDKTDEELSADLCSAVADGGCAVYVCNTVRQAQAFFQVLKEQAEERGIRPYLLHARFPFAERETREADAVARFGKEAGWNSNPPRPERAILVSTQIIEQSLDVDFDLMVTDLAPVDLVLQRSGRLMRHVGAEPPIPRYSFDERNPVLWIRRPAETPAGLPDFGAGEAVYSDYILLRSLLALGTRDRPVHIPGDITELIEAVYDESCDRADVLGDLAERLQTARTKFQKRVDKLCYEAEQRLIKRPGHEAELARVFGEALEEDNPAVHSAFQALTRWSDLPSVTVVCLHVSNERVYLDTGMTHSVDLAAEPDDATLRQLMRATMSLSGHSVSRHFACVETPASWRRIGLLRHLKPAVFEGGVLSGTPAGFSLRLHPELGGVIKYPRREEEDEQ